MKSFVIVGRKNQRRKHETSMMMPSSSLLNVGIVDVVVVCYIYMLFRVLRFYLPVCVLFVSRMGRRIRVNSSSFK